MEVKCWWFCRLDATREDYIGSCFKYQRKCKR